MAYRRVQAGYDSLQAFSTAQNREGIQVGTAIITMVRLPVHEAPAEIHYQDFWGRKKLTELLAWGQRWSAERYRTVEPIAALGYPFRPTIFRANYSVWPLLPEVFQTSLPGVQTKRDSFLVDIDQEVLSNRLQAYFDTELSNHDLMIQYPEICKNTNRYKWETTRAILLRRGMLSQNIVKYIYRPFDMRHVYWEPETKLLGEKSPTCFQHMSIDNLAI